MNGDEPNSPTSNSWSSTLEEISDTEDLLDQSQSIFLRGDSETIYSYFSTWSTNYTMSNLPGPGRIVGNIFSRAGSSLERRLGKIAYRKGVGDYAKAETSLQEFGGWPFDRGVTQKEKEGVCDTLLRYARSNNPAIQLMALKKNVAPYRRLSFDSIQLRGVLPETQ